MVLVVEGFLGGIFLLILLEKTLTTIVLVSLIVDLDNFLFSWVLVYVS